MVVDKTNNNYCKTLLKEYWPYVFDSRALCGDFYMVLFIYYHCEKPKSPAFPLPYGWILTHLRDTVTGYFIWHILHMCFLFFCTTESWHSAASAYLWSENLATLLNSSKSFPCLLRWYAWVQSWWYSIYCNKAKHFKMWSTVEEHNCC